MSLFPFSSLRLRLISSIVIIEVIMLSLLVWSNLTVIQQAHANRLIDTANSLLQQITKTSGSYLFEVDYASLDEYLRNITTHPELAYLLVLDRDEKPVFNLWQDRINNKPKEDKHPDDVTDNIFDVQEDIYIANQYMGRVYMGFTLEHMQHAIYSARIKSIVIAASEISLTIIVTIFIGVHLTRRLGLLASAAEKVGAGDYTVMVNDNVRDEVGTMAVAFNRMVDELAQRKQRLETMMARESVVYETAQDGMITYDADCVIHTVNPAMTYLFGYSREELIGKGTVMLITDVNSETQLWKQTTTGRIEINGVRKNGESFPLELYIGNTTVNGEILYAATLHDITERKKAEDENRSLLKGNRFLIHKSLAVQEEERRYISRELHDQLGQSMTAIQADAELICDLVENDNSKIETSARAIQAVSSDVYDVVHSMMRRLRPAILDDLGLVAAIEAELQSWQLRYPATECKFSNNCAQLIIDEAINISLYRIVQEALTNIA
ncbi:MAG: PAS domain S-box protein, partial [Gammaproteobacteria bacterium]|nr:PAS domain S-box protein [Gammaproteobacteria bacterium]